MSSHAELLSHSCSHCAQQGSFTAPVDLTIDFGEGIRGDCPWYRLAHTWTSTGFKNTLGLTEGPEDGYAWLERDGTSCTGAGGKLHEFEWMVPSQDGSDSFYSLDNKRRMSRLSGDTSSDATFHILKNWVADCESNHEGCSAKAQYQDLRGIRFLRIDNDSVFLEEEVLPTRYACLSHVWGSVQDLLRTNQENKVAHMTEGILIKNLPKTYQDTVIVCKELGINHLWIDSLCIVQNSSQDWNEQASRMAEVYENAYITVAAVSARNSEDGLFNNISDRPTSVPLPEFPWIHIRRKVELPSESHYFMNLDSNDGHILYKRGWTFQELSLSPRVIHYGQDEVIWHCQSRSSRECDPDGMISIPSLVSADWARESGLSVQGLWYRIVEAYSWRNLTFDKDRLPAIAAFASRIQRKGRQKRYLHGLWEDSLRMDLLWSVNVWKEEDHSGPFSEIEQRSLPTWSWTSTKTPVTWDYISNMAYSEEAPHTKIKGVIYNTRGPALLGDAAEARIIIQAPIFKLSDIRLVESSMETSLGDNDEIVWHSPHWDTLSDATKYGKQCTKALAIPLIMIRGEMTGVYSGRYTNSLVIAKTGEVGTYTRVGVTTLVPRVDLAHVTSWSDWDSESPEREKTRALERERSYKRFMQIMEQMEKRTITLI